MSNITLLTSGDNTSDIEEENDSFNHCLKLFGLSSKVLKSLICFKSIRDPMTQKVMEIPVSVEQARTNKNTVSKMIYNQLFDWLIFKVNMSISGNDSQSQNVMLLQRYSYIILS